MPENYIWITIAAIGIPAGIVAGYLVRKSWAVREAKTAEARAEALLAEARNKEKGILLGAKEKAIKLIDDAKREESSRRAELTHLQSRLEKRAGIFGLETFELGK